MPEKNAMIHQADRVLIMGILNVTPDSFYDGGRAYETDAAIDKALAMIEQGADIIDIGGESSRPGADAISVEQELDRVIPVVRRLRAKSSILISVDTTKAAVARASLDAGADLVNDISALRFDPAMASTIAQAQAMVVLMHMQGTPQTMQQAPVYQDVVTDVCAFLMERAQFALDAGIARDHIIVDPGIGFGKRLEHNLELLRQLPKLASCGYPLLVGLSRKSFLGQILDLPASERLEGTIVLNAVAILGGASIIRVHDVKEGRRTADVAVRLRT
ncbi:dihydropteroate synthase [Candidatus Bipolaricaulota bacterium]|nr:dihydropteroate synthase [Candidatus Bipolaricaulota bacterium]TFH10841.1 MAG: dihydropteroate synthase [Candidatus Atribacteria bacterium]